MSGLLYVNTPYRIWAGRSGRPCAEVSGRFVDRNMCTEGATHLTCHFGCSIIGGSQVIHWGESEEKLELQFSIFHIISIFSKMGQQPKKNKNQTVLVFMFLQVDSLSQWSQHRLWSDPPPPALGTILCVWAPVSYKAAPKTPHTLQNRHTYKINRGLYWRAEFIS